MLNQPKITLYIAASLDGFIARENGSVDWLDNLPNPNKIDHGYADFLQKIDVIVMGRKTYEQVLNFGIGWPYDDFTTFVVTRNLSFSLKTQQTFLLNQLDLQSIENLKKKSQKGIWLVGGGEINTAFLEMNAVDEMELFIAPIILGNGVPLFAKGSKETVFECVSSKTFETGIVNVSYKKKTD